MDAGLAALLGAAVGALGTAAAAGVSGFFAQSQTKLQIEAQERQADRQIRADHISQLREPRRQAYAEFSSHAAEQLKRLERAAEVLAADPYLEEEASPLLEESMDPAYNSAYARITMAGPEDVVYLATVVAEALADARVSGLAWVLKHDGEPSPRHPDPEGDMRTALERGKDLLHIFQLLTMRVMREDGGRPEIQQVRDRFRLFSQEDGRSA
jgi:hypothetical protein